MLLIVIGEIGPSKVLIHSRSSSEELEEHSGGSAADL